jgi:uncharacterized membrane protein required for colicin V production
MIVDQVALGILALFVLIGALRGAVATALGIATLVVSYAIALVAGSALGDATATALGLSPFLGGPVAGTIVFLLANVVLGVVSRRLVARRRVTLAAAPASTRALDRVGGGALGALRGGVVVILLGWLVAWADAARVALIPPESVAPGVPGSPIAGAAGSMTARFAEQAIESSLGVVLGDTPSGRVTTKLLARPSETLTGFRDVLARPSIEKLRDDGAFWEALERGDVDRALANGSFRALAFDAPLRADLVGLGALPPEAGSSPQAFEAALDDAVRTIAPRIEGLANDPEVKQLMQDPAVQRALERGDRWTLLRNPSVQRIAQRLAGS